MMFADISSSLSTRMQSPKSTWAGEVEGNASSGNELSKSAFHLSAKGNELAPEDDVLRASTVVLSWAGDINQWMG